MGAAIGMAIKEGAQNAEAGLGAAAEAQTQRKLARRNSALAGVQIQNVEAANAITIERLERRFRRVQGAAEAAIAGSGAGGGPTDTALLVDNAIENALDIGVANFNTKVQVNALRDEIAMSNFQAKMAKKRASFALFSAITGAGGGAIKGFNAGGGMANVRSTFGSSGGSGGQINQAAAGGRGGSFGVLDF